MRRPTKDRAEVITCLAIIIGLFAWRVVEEGWIGAAVHFGIVIAIVLIIQGVLAVVRKVGR